MPRKRAQPAPARSRPSSSSATMLRLCVDVDRAPAVEPEVARFLIAGHPFQLVHWTFAEWEQLSSDQRPGDACIGSKGSVFLFAPLADRQA